MQVDNVIKLIANNGITLQVTDAAISFIADVGYDPDFGARPVKRAIQDHLLNALSKKIISADINREVPIVADVEDYKIVFKNNI